MPPLPAVPLPFPLGEPSFSGQAATEQASGSVGAVKAGEATRSVAEGLALTAQARTTATLFPRRAELGSRFWHGRSAAQPVPSVKPLGGRMGEEAMPGSPARGGGNLGLQALSPVNLR